MMGRIASSGFEFGPPVPYWPPPSDRCPMVSLTGALKAGNLRVQVCTFDEYHGGRHSFEPEPVEDTGCEECGRPYDDEPEEPTLVERQIAHVKRLADEMVEQIEQILWRARALSEFARLIEHAAAEDDEEAEAEEWEDEADREPRTAIVRDVESGDEFELKPGTVLQGDRLYAIGFPAPGMAAWEQVRAEEKPDTRLGLDRCPKRRTSGDGFVSVNPCTYAAGHEPPCSWDRPRIPTTWPPPPREGCVVLRGAHEIAVEKGVRCARGTLGCWHDHRGRS